MRSSCLAWRRSNHANPKNVGVLLGSLRKASTSAALAQALEHLRPSDLSLQEIAMGDMPIYNPDEQEHTPASCLAFRKRILACDAVLFVSPEYNRSIPAVLKNAIDAGSRPKGQSVWNGKPAAIRTFSPGNLGGFGAHHHLRQSFACLNMPTMPAPEIYLSGSAKLFDAHGAIANPDTRALLAGALKSFARWIDLNRSDTQWAPAA